MEDGTKWILISIIAILVIGLIISLVFVVKYKNQINNTIPKSKCSGADLDKLLKNDSDKWSTDDKSNAMNFISNITGVSSDCLNKQTNSALYTLLQKICNPLKTFTYTAKSQTTSS